MILKSWDVSGSAWLERITLEKRTPDPNWRSPITWARLGLELVLPGSAARAPQFLVSIVLSDGSVEEGRWFSDQTRADALVVSLLRHTPECYEAFRTWKPAHE
jgi:hypothetical protein